MALRTPDDVFADYAGRRRGILRALTSDVDSFYQQCDPGRENLCLYGYSDGSWDVTMPCEEVPPELPEPSIGINFARDGMKRHDWLSLVAVHSDSWLMAIAFYNAARLNSNGRRQLFNDINSLPTCYEIVSGRAGSSGAGARPTPGKRRRVGEGGEEEGEGGEEDASECPNCHRFYQEGEFWLTCDECGRWFDGQCSDLTEEAWESRENKQWCCPLCLSNKAA